MSRIVLLSCLLIIATVFGCGRQEPYRYPPPEPVMLLPDGGLPDGGKLDAGVLPPACIPLKIDTYVLPTKRRPIDVLFVVDDSRSMRDDQDALAANFMSFITSFTMRDVDFHLGTVTTDMAKATRKGRLVLPFLTQMTANLPQKFSDMVRVGIDGSGDEQGLAAAHAALSEPLLSTTNSGFLRPDADLGIVFLSDENDHSPESVTTFVNFIKTLKPTTAQMSIAAIVGLQSFNCSTSNWKYVQAARALGPRGLVSACNPQYASTLAAVSGRLLTTNCIIGLNSPITEDMNFKVHLNGQDWFFFRVGPDTIYPNGSIELIPCPETGGTVELITEVCP